MTSADKNAPADAGYTSTGPKWPDVIDVWAALESVYWPAVTTSSPWADAVAALVDNLLTVEAARLVLAKYDANRDVDEDRFDPRALVVDDVERLVVGEQAWPTRLTKALTDKVRVLPWYFSGVADARHVAMFGFARRAQLVVDALAAGQDPDPAALAPGPPVHERTDDVVFPAELRDGPNGWLITAAYEQMERAEEAAQDAHELGDYEDEETGDRGFVVPEHMLGDYEQLHDEAILWPTYLGDWAFAASYVLATDHRDRLISMIARKVTGR